MFILKVHQSDSDGRAKMVVLSILLFFQSVIRPAANRFINVMLEHTCNPIGYPPPRSECLKETYGIMVMKNKFQWLLL